MSNFSRDITIDQIANVIDFYEPHYFGYYSKLYQFNITVIIPALYLAIKFPYMNPDTQDPIISIAFRDHSLIVEVATIIFDLKSDHRTVQGCWDSPHNFLSYSCDERCDLRTLLSRVNGSYIIQ